MAASCSGVRVSIELSPDLRLFSGIFSPRSHERRLATVIATVVLAVKLLRVLAAHLAKTSLVIAQALSAHRAKVALCGLFVLETNDRNFHRGITILLLGAPFMLGSTPTICTLKTLRQPPQKNDSACTEASGPGKRSGRRSMGHGSALQYGQIGKIFGGDLVSSGTISPLRCVSPSTRSLFSNLRRVSLYVRHARYI